MSEEPVVCLLFLWLYNGQVMFGDALTHAYIATGYATHKWYIHRGATSSRNMQNPAWSSKF